MLEWLLGDSVSSTSVTRLRDVGHWSSLGIGEMPQIFYTFIPGAGEALPLDYQPKVEKILLQLAKDIGVNLSHTTNIAQVNLIHLEQVPHFLLMNGPYNVLGMTSINYRSDSGIIRKTVGFNLKQLKQHPWAYQKRSIAHEVLHALGNLRHPDECIRGGVPLTSAQCIQEIFYYGHNEVKVEESAMSLPYEYHACFKQASNRKDKLNCVQQHLKAGKPYSETDLVAARAELQEAQNPAYQSPYIVKPWLAGSKGFLTTFCAILVRAYLVPRLIDRGFSKEIAITHGQLFLFSLDVHLYSLPLSILNLMIRKILESFSKNSQLSIIITLVGAELIITAMRSALEAAGEFTNLAAGVTGAGLASAAAWQIIRTLPKLRFEPPGEVTASKPPHLPRNVRRRRQKMNK